MNIAKSLIICYNKRRLEKQPLVSRGKSGQHRIRWSLTATVRKNRESTTETIPLCICGVRVKSVR